MDSGYAADWISRNKPPADRILAWLCLHRAMLRFTEQLDGSADRCARQPNLIEHPSHASENLGGSGAGP